MLASPGFYNYLRLVVNNERPLGDRALPVQCSSIDIAVRQGYSVLSRIYPPGLLPVGVGFVTRSHLFYVRIVLRI